MLSAVPVWSLLFAGLSSLLGAEIGLPSVIGDHMVLQREQANPIWGWADAAADVTVSFAGSEVSSKTDSEGRWRVVLPALEASNAGRTLTIHRASGDSVAVHDVLVGEVWFFNGPSNIYWPVERCENAQKEITAADFPAIRFSAPPGNLLMNRRKIARVSGRSVARTLLAALPVWPTFSVDG